MVTVITRRFVTPGAFKSIAESIQNVTRDMPNSDEQFANAVLMLVRQVSYVRSDVKYPVEALVDNSGDCDVLSLLAASIMKAGGLDVVLLYYKGLSPSHMNVGVYLPYKPVYRTWWMAPTGFEYDNKTYWMAECTPRGEWKVGDRPELLTNAEPQIISLENCEKSSPAHVSSSLDSSLDPLVYIHNPIFRKLECLRKRAHIHDFRFNFAEGFGEKRTNVR